MKRWLWHFTAALIAIPLSLMCLFGLAMLLAEGLGGNGNDPNGWCLIAVLGIVAAIGATLMWLDE